MSVMKLLIKNSRWILSLVVTVLLLVDTSVHSIAAVSQQQPQQSQQPQQQPPTPQPGPGKKFVQGIFGPLEVDVSDPRPGIAFGPPLQPAAPPPQVPAQPAPQAGQPAQAQPDEIVLTTLRFNNGDIYAVI